MHRTQQLYAYFLRWLATLPALAFASSEPPLARDLFPKTDSSKSDAAASPDHIAIGSRNDCTCCASESHHRDAKQTRHPQQAKHSKNLSGGSEDKFSDRQQNKATLSARSIFDLNKRTVVHLAHRATSSINTSLTSDTNSTANYRQLTPHLAVNQASSDESRSTNLCMLKVNSIASTVKKFPADKNDAERILPNASAGTELDITYRDGELYSIAPWGTTPRNGFYYINNTFGRGFFQNCIDYYTLLKANPKTFPNQSLIEWRWPDAGSGASFAYAYPEIIYGASPFGNPYNTVGPWPQKVSDIKVLRVNYDIALGGNVQSYNILLDLYLTASPTTIDGTHASEVSFFPYISDPGNLTGVHQFSWGPASITRQQKLILIRPIAAKSKPRQILTASIDLKEILDYLIKLQWISGDEYLRGAEFGPEIQVPNSYNNLPHEGFLFIRALSYHWR